jgi:hypothetical protein
MVDYFQNWRQTQDDISPPYFEQLLEKDFDDDSSTNETDLILQEFISNPKEYFDMFQEKSCSTISARLNNKLIERNPELFIQSYKESLKLICFCEEKELPLKTIIDTVTLDRQGREEIIHFLLGRELIEKTYRVLKVLEREEQEIFLNILEKKNI